MTPGPAGEARAHPGSPLRAAEGGQQVDHQRCPEDVDSHAGGQAENDGHPCRGDASEPAGQQSRARVHCVHLHLGLYSVHCSCPAVNQATTTIFTAIQPAKPAYMPLQSCGEPGMYCPTGGLHQMGAAMLHKPCMTADPRQGRAGEGPNGSISRLRSANSHPPQMRRKDTSVSRHICKADQRLASANRLRGGKHVCELTVHQSRAVCCAAAQQ